MRKKNLKSVVRPAQIPAHLTALPHDVHEALKARLLKGEGGWAAATWLQDQGYLEGLAKPNLKKTLERYREKTLRPAMFADIAEANSSVKTSVVLKRLDAIEEMSDLVSTQKVRLKKALDTEAKLPNVVTKQASMEIKLLADILKNLGALQLETGILHRAPKTISGSTVDPKTGDVQEFSWTEEQQKLYDDLEQSIHTGTVPRLVSEDNGTIQ